MFFISSCIRVFAISVIFDSVSGTVVFTEDARLNLTQLITKHGYDVTTYTVETGDGYLLSMQRLAKRSSSEFLEERKKKNGPVLIMHGLLNSATDWIISGPNKSLAYLLTEHGYDVWLGNARGNTHSRRHKSLSPSDSQFWQFSWHEIGVYDLPAMIDLILQESGHTSLQYIGFSQGTTSFYVMAAMRPEYNRKIRLMSALAPVAFCSQMKSPLVQFFATFERTTHRLLRKLMIDEFLPNSETVKQAGGYLCQERGFRQNICTNTVFLLSGFNMEQLNLSLIPAIVGHTPAGASTRQLIHYAQLINSGTFRRYDFGLKANRHIYGSYLPPNYDLHLVTSPVALHYSDNDWLSHPLDVAQLAEQLPNVVGEFRVPLDSFTHLDFLWAIDAPSLLYKRILQIMELY